jgi:hypothetical protein
MERRDKEYEYAEVVKEEAKFLFTDKPSRFKAVILKFSKSKTY